MKTTFFTIAVALVTSVAFAQLPHDTADGDLIVGLCKQDPDQPHLQTCYVCLAPEFTFCEDQTCTKDDPPACGPTVRIAGSAYADVHAAFNGLEFYTKVLDDAQRGGRPALEAYALGNVGLAYSFLGDPRRALSAHDRALVIHRETGDRYGEASVMGDLGQAYLDVGDARTALSVHERTLAIADEIGDRRGVAYTRYHMSLALDRLGRRLEAVAQAEAALAMLEEQKNRYAVVVSRQLEAWRDPR